MIRKYKSKRLILALILVLVVILTPSIYGYYFSKITSTKNIQLVTNHDMTKTYVRAHLITYWVDLTSCEDSSDETTCNVAGKIPWDIDTSKINSEWTLINGYYYYASNVTLTDIDNMPTNIALINPELEASELSSNELVVEQYAPQYKVIYEFLEGGTTANNKTTSEQYWCVTFSNNVPELIEGCTIN